VITKISFPCLPRNILMRSIVANLENFHLHIYHQYSYLSLPSNLLTKLQCFTSFSGNDKYDEIVAGIQFLEALLHTSTQKAVKHRSKLIELQKIVSSLSLEKRQRLILSSNELCTVKNVIDELLTLEVACTDLQRSDIQPEFASDSVLRTLNLKKLEHALNKQEQLKIESAVYFLVVRAHSLSTAVDSILKCVEELLKHCQAVYYTDGWTACNRSSNFVSYMNSLSLPVCNEVCAFLQSPKDYTHGLLFPFGYVFAVNELAGIFNYFKLQHLLLGSMPTFSIYSVSAITTCAVANSTTKIATL
jgi:hypothetical protein